MSTCLRCGAQNPDDHRFCKDCGGALTTPNSGEVDDDTIIIQLLEGRGNAISSAGHIAASGCSTSPANMSSTLCASATSR